MLTRCPHCTASFRVSDAQLQAAHGKVRCGACMKVFNAAEHLLTDELTAAKPSPAKKPASMATQSGSISSKDEDVFANMDLDGEIAVDDDLDALTRALSDAGDEIDEDLLFQDNPEEDKTDARYAGGLVNEQELSESFKDLGKQKDNDLDSFEFEDEEVEGNNKGNDESWAEQMLKELERPLPPANESAGSGESVSSNTDTPPPSEPVPESYIQESIPSRDQDMNLGALRPEPFNAHPSFVVEDSGEWVKKAIWAAGIIGLIAFLFAQLAWFHFDTLARYDQLRPLYGKACAVFGCKLPSLYDISQIRSQNLVVRSHPLVNKALIIDAIIINQASFEQPFPDIALTFSDLNNNVIAQRTFTRGEYLSGEAKNMKVMPPTVPIHIALEILDPGKDAVNYTMGFVHNKAYQEAENQ